MGLFMKFFPVLSIAMWLINVAIIKTRVSTYIDDKPELEEGYNRLLLRLALYGIIPWIVMGIGILSGLTNNVFDYILPATINVAVIAFYLSIIILYAALGYWIFLNGGAKTLTAYPGLVAYNSFGSRKDVTSEKGIQGFFAIMAISSVGAIVFMCFAHSFVHFPHQLVR